MRGGGPALWWVPPPPPPPPPPPGGGGGGPAAPLARSTPTRAQARDTPKKVKNIIRPNIYFEIGIFFCFFAQNCIKVYLDKKITKNERYHRNY
ncbi:MAG: hypothetical protein RML94_11805 [Bacteroidia bacterium]|nr:hypothetical protein [Bacteroidia bacterium]